MFLADFIRKRFFDAVFGAGLFFASTPAFASEADIPPQGRSYFDHIIQRIGRIPFPPDEILSYMEKKEGKKVLGTVFGNSRALERFDVTMESPREIYAFETPNSYSPMSSKEAAKNLLQGVPDTMLFIGYTPKANTLEVISFNPTLGRYEFQVVKNYGPGLKPELHYSPRALCMSCHQGGSPIFSLNPWDESTQSAWDSRIETAVKRAGDRSKYLYRNKKHEFKNAAIENLTNRSENVVDFQKFWSSACGKSPATKVQCRRLILKSAVLDHMTGASWDDRNSALEELRKVLKKSWPKGEISTVSSELLNRDPMRYPYGSVLSEDLDALSPLNRTQLDFDTSLTKRGYLSYGKNADIILKVANEYLPKPAIQALLKATSGDPKKLLEALESPKLNEVLAQDAFSAPDFFRQMLKVSGVKTGFRTLAQAESKMPVPTIDHVSGAAARGTGPFHTMKRYCSQCHTAGEPPFAFMRGSDEEIAANLRNPVVQERIRERLEAFKTYRMMPPMTSGFGQAFMKNEEAYGKLMGEFTAFISQGTKVDGLSPTAECVHGTLEHGLMPK